MELELMNNGQWNYGRLGGDREGFVTLSSPQSLI